MSGFTEGQQVYLPSGNCARYVCASERNHIVRLLTRDEDGEEYYDEIYVATKVLAKPPREVFDAGVEEAREQLSALNASIRKARTELAEAEAEKKRRMATLTAVPALALLEDFIAGRITHYVEETYAGVEIIAFADATCAYEKRNLRLLTLFGKSNGNLQWNLGRYSDGSGGGADVVPCTSLEAAQAAARKILDTRYDELRTTGKGYLDYTIAAAQKLGFDVPDDIMALQRQRAVANATERLREAEARIAELRAVIASEPPK